MERRGPLECTIGKYQIFQRIMIGLNGEKPKGYELVGPGADSTWNYNLDVAIKTAHELDQKYSSK